MKKISIFIHKVFFETCRIILFFVFIQSLFNSLSAQISPDGTFDPTFEPKELLSNEKKINFKDTQENKSIITGIENILNNLPEHIKYNYIDRLVRTGHGKAVENWLDNPKNEKSITPIWRKYLRVLISYYIYNDDSALSKLRELVIEERDFWRARLSLAEIFYLQKNWSAAENHYDRLILNSTISPLDRALIKSRIRHLQKLAPFAFRMNSSVLSPIKYDINYDNTYLEYLPIDDNNDLTELSAGYGLQNKIDVDFSPFSTRSLDLTFSMNLVTNNYQRAIFNNYIGELKTNLRLKNSSYNNFSVYSSVGKKYLSSIHVSDIKKLGFNLHQVVNDKFLLHFEANHIGERNLYNSNFDEDSVLFFSSISYLQENKSHLTGKRKELFTGFQSSKKQTDPWQKYKVGTNISNELSSKYNLFYGGYFSQKEFDHQYLSSNKTPIIYSLRFNADIQFINWKFYNLTPIVGLNAKISHSNINDLADKSININIQFTQTY